MSRAAPPERAAKSANRTLLRWARDRRGVSAVEFALIAPVLIVMWGGVITLTQAIMVQQRANHMAYAVGDLVAAQASLSAGYVTNAMAAGALIMQPMQATYAQRVDEVVEQGDGTDTIVWSCSDPTNGLPPYTQGQIVWEPYNSLNAYGPGTNVIQSEIVVNFKSPLTVGFLPNGFSYTYVKWFFPRAGTSIAKPPQC